MGAKIIPTPTSKTKVTDISVLSTDTVSTNINQKTSIIGANTAGGSMNEKTNSVGGNINQKVIPVTYKGGETETAVVKIDNYDRKITVDVKAIEPDFDIIDGGSASDWED